MSASVPQWVKRDVKLLVLLVLVASAFRYNGSGHTYLWAGVILLAIALVWGWLQPEEANFEPFWVRVWPTRALLADQGFATEEQLQSMSAAGTFEPPAESLIRDGVMFTLLTPSNGRPGSGRVYWNLSNRFTTDIDRETEVVELPQPGGRHLPEGRTWCPSIYLRRMPDGLSLRVVTLKNSIRAEERGADLGKEVALLPWGEFGMPELMAAEKREALLSEHGWTHERHGGVSELRHRYFRVLWAYI